MTEDLEAMRRAMQQSEVRRARTRRTWRLVAALLWIAVAAVWAYLEWYA